MTLSPMRAAVLRESWAAVANGCTGFSVYTAIDDRRGHKLIVEMDLEDGPTARFADLLFRGSERALECNGWLFIEGGFRALAQGILAAVADMEHERHVKRRKRDRASRRVRNTR